MKQDMKFIEILACKLVVIRPDFVASRSGNSSNSYSAISAVNPKSLCKANIGRKLAWWLHRNEKMWSSCHPIRSELALSRPSTEKPINKDKNKPGPKLGQYSA